MNDFLKKLKKDQCCIDTEAVKRFSTKKTLWWTIKDFISKLNFLGRNKERL